MVLTEIRELTLKCSGEFGLNHVDRLLKLIEIIGEDQDYDSRLIWIAAHLHDWGAYQPYVETGKDHAIRSREVAAEILNQLNLDERSQAIVLDAIREHNTSGDCSSVESTLLRDADYLDFLGFIGIVRDIVRRPQDLKKAMEMIAKRISYFEFLLLPKSIELGKERLAEINYFLERMELEAFGLY